MRQSFDISTDCPIAFSEFRKADLANVVSSEVREPKTTHLASWFSRARQAKKRTEVGLAFWPKRVRRVRVNRMLSPSSKVSVESGLAFANREPTHALRRDILDSESRSVPNQAPEPTPPLVTIRAYARLAPSSAVAHL